MLGIERLFTRTNDGVSVYPREIGRGALRQNASAVIFSPNYPSNVAEPSQADRDITTELRRALATVSVCVLDHTIVGASDAVSMAERDLL